LRLLILVNLTAFLIPRGFGELVGGVGVLVGHLPIAIRCKPSSIRTTPLKDFLGVANILQPELDARQDMARGRMRRDLSQGLKFNVA
jgi:hypothetical protein